MSDCLVLFAREPIAGRVKTRLAQELGADVALTLYQRMLLRTLRLAHRYARIRSVQVECHAQGLLPGAWLTQHAALCGIPVREQHDGDLGARMAAAFRMAAVQYDRIVLIGTDLPCLRAADLEQAFCALDTADMVISPAADGGYGLIGARLAQPGLFTGIDWGTQHVAQQTRERARALGLSWHELRELWDVDVAADLDAWLGYRPISVEQARRGRR